MLVAEKDGVKVVAPSGHESALCIIAFQLNINIRRGLVTTSINNIVINYNILTNFLGQSSIR